MADTSGATTTTNPNPSQAAEQFTATLTAADGNVTQGLQTLQLVHQARLSLAKRTLTSLTAQYGANDPRVKTAQAAVTAKTTTIGKISLARQQLTAPQVQVNKAGWALQGRVVDATLQPAARFTVFLVDGTKAYQQQYGFAYTDDTGYFLISYAGDSTTKKASAAAAAVPQLFVEVADTKANPVYLSSIAFQPVLGTASFQNIVLPAGGQPIGDPPEAIKKIALPQQPAQVQPGEPSQSSKT
jgi:hypothetical protein